MAGGIGGAGGSPNGAAGFPGQVQLHGTMDPAAGGAGGDNGYTITDGTDVLGPYGQGGAGADAFVTTASDGSPGAVVIIWGHGSAVGTA